MTTTHYLGNTDTIATGYFAHDGVFTAMTRVQCKEFKTEAGAIRWLAARGYDAQGRRVSQ